MHINGVRVHMIHKHIAAHLHTSSKWLQADVCSKLLNCNQQQMQCFYWIIGLLDICGGQRLVAQAVISLLRGARCESIFVPYFQSLIKRGLPRSHVA